MAFKKGHSGNPKGRPEGSKNKSYLDASHWLQRADAEVEKQDDPSKRMEVIKWATELIMAKVPALPATPGDSLSNALMAQTLVKSLENDAVNASTASTGS